MQSKQRKLFILLLLSGTLQAATINHDEISSREDLSDYSSIVINTLWGDAGHTAPIDDFRKKSQQIIPDSQPDQNIPPQEDEQDTKEKLDNIVDNQTTGKLKINTIKKLNNKTKLKVDVNNQKNPLDKLREKNIKPIKNKGSAMSIIEQKKAENRRKLKEKAKQIKQETSQTTNKKKSLLQLRNEGLSQMKKKQSQTRDDWKKTIQQTYARWKKQRAIYEKNIPQHKEATFDILESSFDPKVKTSLKAPLNQAIKTDYHIIPDSLDLRIQNQGKRPTCAAFTGVRALEVLMAAGGRKTELSEQYFYWASKPKCQRFPCARRGSWVTNALDKSQSANFPDIPLEKDCPYQLRHIPDNETQVPLEMSCQRGFVKVNSYKKLYRLDEVASAIKNNSPIIAGFTLTPNFYQAKGLVTYKGSFKNGSMDGHAGGHALLIVGLMKLPKSMHYEEGKYCFIVSNSWGEGWGRGGHSCLTEKWVRVNKVENPFIALESVSFKE